MSYLKFIFELIPESSKHSLPLIYPSLGSCCCQRGEKIEIPEFFGSKTNVKSMWGTMEYIRVRVDVRQGFALNPYLFSIQMDEVMKEIQGKV